jgi:hypothetical protein
MKKLLLTLTSLALLSTSLYAGCTTTVDMDGNRITDLGAPTTGTDAVNRDYVDQFTIFKDTGLKFTCDNTWRSISLSNNEGYLIKNNQTVISYFYTATNGYGGYNNLMAGTIIATDGTEPGGWGQTSLKYDGGYQYKCRDLGSLKLYIHN